MVQAIEIPESCFFWLLQTELLPRRYFGYAFELKSLKLPQASHQLNDIDELRRRLEESLPFVTLDSDSAGREFLIAPLLLELIHLTHVKVKVSYSLKVSEQLKGSLDYYLQAGNRLLVIEVKDENLERGFKQLAVELIALDRILESSDNNYLCGAISTGRVWQFAYLDRQRKKMTQDLELYRVPADLEVLMAILVAILTEAPST